MNTPNLLGATVTLEDARDDLLRILRQKVAAGDTAVVLCGKDSYTAAQRLREVEEHTELGERWVRGMRRLLRLEALQAAYIQAGYSAIEALRKAIRLEPATGQV